VSSAVRVFTNVESLGNFVGGPGKIAYVTRLCNCCCSVVSGQKRDVLSLIVWIGFLLFILLFLN